MSKKLFARGSDGLIAICDGALTEAQIDDPLNNLANIWFHSNLEYMNARKVFSGTAVFPARPAEGTWYNYVSREEIASFSLPEPPSPLCFGFFSDGQLIDGFSMIQSVSESAWRAAGLMMSNYSTLSLVEYAVYASSSLPAISKDYTIYVLSAADVQHF
jgi:hypothetical protein